METESRVAVIGIVVDQTGDTEELNKDAAPVRAVYRRADGDSLPQTKREYYQRRD